MIRLSIVNTSFTIIPQTAYPFLYIYSDFYNYKYITAGV